MTKKKRKVCWKCKRKLVITKLIKLVSDERNAGSSKFKVMVKDEQFWCVECMAKLNNHLDKYFSLVLK